MSKSELIEMWGSAFGIDGRFSAILVSFMVEYVFTEVTEDVLRAAVKKSLKNDRKPIPSVLLSYCESGECGEFVNLRKGKVLEAGQTWMVAVRQDQLDLGVDNEIDFFESLNINDMLEDPETGEWFRPEERMSRLQKVTDAN